MSLGDRLRLLRAQNGGVTPAEIEASLPELPKGVYRYMEQRYRAVGDDATIAMLAGYFGVPFEDLRGRLDWPRKALSRALYRAQTDAHPIMPGADERGEDRGQGEVVGSGCGRGRNRDGLHRGATPCHRPVGPV